MGTLTAGFLPHSLRLPLTLVPQLLTFLGPLETVSTALVRVDTTQKYIFGDTARIPANWYLQNQNLIGRLFMFILMKSEEIIFE